MMVPQRHLNAFRRLLQLNLVVPIQFREKRHH
jgi:hypothetical protein